MLKPKYIIVCEKRLVEVASGLVSHVNVIEQLIIPKSFQAAIQNPMFFPAIRMFATAVWMREVTSDNANELFELDARVHFTGIDKPVTAYVGESVFVTPHLRLDFALPPMPQMSPGNGHVIVEARIRSKGTLDWISQQYDIPVTVESPTSVA